MIKKYTKFYRYLLPFWKREALILFLSVIAVALSLVNPYLTKLVIDKAYGNKDLKLFIILIGVGGAIFVLNGLISGLASYLSRYIRLRLNFNLSRQVFSKLQRLSYSFFQNNSTGENLFRISYDVEQTAQFLTDALPQAISLIPRSLFIFGIVLYLDRRMAMLALGLTPFLYIAPIYFNRRLKKVYKIWVENSQGVFRHLHEVLSHIQLVKAFGREKGEIRAYVRKLVQNIRFKLKSTRIEVAGSFANNLANRLILGLVIFYGGYQVIKGKMTLGTLSAISIYLSQLSGLQGSFAQFFQQLSLGSVSCQRLNSILEAASEVKENRDAQEITLIRGDIEFQGVTFGDDEGRVVLDNLSFHIGGGSVVALAGPSGCGKTTVVNLLLRLYAPMRGEILIDGYRIADIKSKSLYGQIGVVLQEPFLWNDSVENNIRYGRQDASIKEVMEAARVACIDGFIDSLPDGYKTVVGENACKISEGQKQRIAIARSVIKRPKILILDEALSCVDAMVEGRIIENIKNSLRGSTLILISHRLSAIAKMDLVYFLTSPGKIDIASHEGLLRGNIHYQDYLAHQLGEENLLDISQRVCYNPKHI